MGDRTTILIRKGANDVKALMYRLAFHVLLRLAELTGAFEGAEPPKPVRHLGAPLPSGASPVPTVRSRSPVLVPGRSLPLAFPGRDPDRVAPPAAGPATDAANRLMR